MNEKLKLKVGYLPLVEALPLFIAKERDIFLNNGLDVELVEFTNGGGVISATVKDEVVGGIAGTVPLLFAIERGAPIRAFSDCGVINQGPSASFALLSKRRGRIANISHLKNRVIAINGFNTNSDLLLHAIFHRNDSKIDAKIVTLPFRDIIYQLASGKIDGGILQEPFVTKGVYKHGLKLLADSRNYLPNFHSSLMFFSQKYASASPITCRVFQSCLDSAIEFIAQYPSDSKRMIGKYLKVEKEFLESITFPAWDMRIGVEDVITSTRKVIGGLGFRPRGSIAVDNITVVYKREDGITKAVESTSFKVEAGEFLCILGPSACGKTTTLYAIAGFIKLESGRILLDNKLIQGPAAERGVVFQKHLLFPWKTVWQNIEFSLSSKGINRADREKMVNSLIADIGLKGFERAYPDQLSGGMEQRVGIARVLASEPLVMLMDEPFSSLDSRTRLSMQELILKIWHEFNCTIIFVTHDIDEAIFLGDRVIVMTPSPGKIREDIDINLARPRTPGMLATDQFADYKEKISALISIDN